MHFRSLLGLILPLGSGPVRKSLLLPCAAALAAGLLLTPAFLGAAGKELEGTRAPTQSECPSPEEARKKMTVPEGYEVRCFAHEPMIQNPVAMTWDERGRLWVVELYEYPEGTPLPVDKRPFGGVAKDDKYRPVPELCIEENKEAEGKIPRDRVIILEDTDNDGVADKRTVFVQGLDMGSAILCGDGGVYVGQQPHLLHFKDTNGDDKPDEWRVVLTGFGREDTHELLNSFTWGPDGWLYMTHGVFTNSKVRRPGDPVQKGFKFDAGIGRCKPLTGEFEVFADGTSNPWGADYDANGNFFVSACVIDHFFHMAPGGIYVRQGGAPENPYAYELLPSIVKHKHFRAAYAGIQIYQGGVYPKDTHGHAFIGNIHDNAIHEEVITPVGSSFKCEPRRDFLRANDGWFRPVSTQTGPDGNLWVMDWCDKYPCYQNAKANPEGVDRARGRIWQVVTTGAKNASREQTALNLGELGGEELVKLMEHPNNWMRRTARRMLVERNDDLGPAKAALQKLTSAESATLRFEALCTLHQCDQLDGKVLDARVTDKDAGIRAWVARLSGERFRILDLRLAAIADDKIMITSEAENKAVELLWPELDRVQELQKDPEMSVRLAVAVAYRMAASGALTANREIPHYEKMFRPLVRTYYMMEDVLKASAQSHDQLLKQALWMVMERGLEQDSPETLFNGSLQYAIDCQPLSHDLVYKAMRRLCDTRQAEELNEAVRYCDTLQKHEVLLGRALEGLLKGQDSGVIKPTTDVSKQLASWRASKNPGVAKSAAQLAVLWGDAEATNQLIAAVAGDKMPTEERLQAIKTLRKVKSDAVRAGLLKLLGENLPTVLGMEAIRAAADLGGDAFPPALISLAASKDNNIRLAALESLAGRKDWAKQMLDAIAAEKISAGGFPVPVRRSLATNGDKGIRDQALKVLGAWKESSSDVKSLIEAKKKMCLEGTPDLEQGKMMFIATCAVCHPFHGGGQKVGPDLIGSGRSNLDALLANVIDPNQIIGNGYENMVATTKDGRTVAGRLVEDTPAHVKLLAAGGAEQLVPRDQLAKLENTHQSLMPSGFGALPDEPFRNMIWYILAPPEEGPLTKEKKDMLVKGVEGVEAAKKPAANNWYKPDWESVSLWNPQWKITAPEFERTPVKLTDFHGRQNVLLMHPFDPQKPCVVERTLKLDGGKSQKVKAVVAAHDQGDWELRVKINGKEVAKQEIGHDGERWKTVSVDLAPYAGREVNIRLEGTATGWAWEFCYWGEVKVE